MTWLGDCVHNVTCNKWIFAQPAMTNFSRREIHRLITLPIRIVCLTFMLRCVRRISVLLAILPLLAYASTDQSVQNSIPIADQKLAQMVMGIISYTQWTQPDELVHVCVIDSPHYFNVLLPLQAKSPQQLRVWSKTAKATDLTQQCHVLFFENTPPAQQQEIINQRGVRRILTLSLNQPACVVGSSFCLSITHGVPSFSLNLDSLKQSGVKISSKVLILAKPLPQQD